MPPVSLVFLVRSLQHGGAERQLVELAKTLDKASFDVVVLTFYDAGTFSGELENVPGVRLVSVNRRGRRDILPFLLRLIRAAREAKPRIVHGYMDGANTLSWLVGRLLGARVVWGLRSSYDLRSPGHWLSRASARIDSWLSSFPDAILVNSHAGREYYRTLGYCSKRMTVIPNGIDVSTFRPNPADRASVRMAWGVGPNDILIGNVARLDPLKGHPTFLEAAALVSSKRRDLRFVLIGQGPDEYELTLRALAGRLGLGDSVIWAGDRSDMCAVYNALDLSTSASESEGFSNAVAESMACGIPCVATRVGDSELIVGDTGLLVPPGDRQSLASAWESLLSRSKAERETLGRRARARIVARFNREILASRMKAALLALLEESPRDALGHDFEVR